MAASLLPLLMTSDPWELQLQRSRRANIDWDHFGMGIPPHELKMLKNFPKLYDAHQNGQDLPGDYYPLIGDEGYQVSLDVRQFRPNEITVKSVGNVVVIEGHHEERLDVYGSISRQFIRKYQMPKGFDVKDVVTTLSSDGVLTIKVPPSKLVASNARIVQIQQTGPAHLNVKENLAIDENANGEASKRNGK